MALTGKADISHILSSASTKLVSVAAIANEYPLPRPGSE